MRSTVTFELKGHLNTPGFRPYIWKMAAEARLGGWVAETPGGASLRLIGEDEAIGEFIRAPSGETAADVPSDRDPAGAEDSGAADFPGRPPRVPSSGSRPLFLRD